MSAEFTKLDKRARAALFRERLLAAMDEAGLSRSALARAAGVDRSTLSQLLAEGETRLPNAQLIAEAASTLGVSTDWLLGLTERPERPGDLVAASMRVARVDEAPHTPADEQLIRWHDEARGYKIRYVPATLPDILKTDAVLEWEYGAFLGKTPEQAIHARRERLDLLRSGASDYEIAVPLHEITTFAQAEGYYAGVPRDVRRDQLRHLGGLCAQLYPSLRLHFYDAHRLYSAPITIFGPILAIVYVGQFYLAFRGEDRVRSMTRHFDWLVRECEVDARASTGFLESLVDRA